MGKPYRFAIYLKWQCGISVSYDHGFIVLDIPFIKLMLNVTRDAEGTNLTY